MWLTKQQPRCRWPCFAAPCPGPAPLRRRRAAATCVRLTAGRHCTSAQSCRQGVHSSMAAALECRPQGAPQQLADEPRPADPTAPTPPHPLQQRPATASSAHSRHNRGAALAPQGVAVRDGHRPAALPRRRHPPQPTDPALPNRALHQPPRTANRACPPNRLRASSKRKAATPDAAADASPQPASHTAISHVRCAAGY